jgi:hypothetical protein
VRQVREEGEEGGGGANDDDDDGKQWKHDGQTMERPQRKPYF